MVKFSKDLSLNVVERWSQYYIDYAKLKSLLTKGAEVVQTQGPYSDEVNAAKAQFKTAIDQELKKINSFYYAQTAQFREEVENRKKRARSGSMTADFEVSSSHYDVFRDLNDIQKYLYINAEGFRKIMKKYDKRFGLRGTEHVEGEAFEATLAEQPFVTGEELKVCTDILKSEQKWNQGGRARGAEMKIISGSANMPLAEEISGRMGMPLTPITIKKFADGEIFVQIQENVRGADIFLIQSTCQPVNDNLMELLLIVGALRRASAERVTAVIPYYGYARQDRKDRSAPPRPSRSHPPPPFARHRSRRPQRARERVDSAGRA
jgi:ribose-phosphate pyrophosphokinase